LFTVAYHIARNTFRECLRHPIYIIMLLSALCIIGWYPWLSLFVFRQQEKLVTDGSLATILLFGLITAVLCASHAIYREIETGTILLVLSKPVNRGVFIIAKMLGIIGALTIFVWITSIGTLFAVRIGADQFELDLIVIALHFGGMILACCIGGYLNYYRRAAFAAVSTKALFVIFSVLVIVVYFLPAYEHNMKWGVIVGYNWNLVRAAILVMFAVWAMAALATALSTKLNMVTNLTVCLVIFILGLSSQYSYDQVIDMKSTDTIMLMHYWFYLLAPCLLAFWILALKHFDARENHQLRRGHFHTAFGTCMIALLVLIYTNEINDEALSNTALWMKIVGGMIHEVKDIVALTIHAFVPNWQLFWMADALAAKSTIPSSYVVFGAGYVAILIFFFFLGGLLMFTSREVGLQSQQ
jgi:ABC-type transport system involved in multi-copper enzyme maturation permease subunit